MNNYNYHNWAAYPSDMVGYFLLRDFARSGLFKAVIDFTNINISPTYFIDGILEEFYEKYESGIRVAVVSVGVIMVNDKETDVTKKVVFQQNYKAETPCIENTFKGFAAAMSESIENISKRIIDDIYTILSADF